MPGWSYTNAGLPSDPLRIDSVSVTPDPLKPGSAATLRIDGTVQREIQEGAYFDLTIKIGLVKILHRRFDLFEELRGGGSEALRLSCDTSDGKGPVPVGGTVLTAAIDLPGDVPRGKFKLQVRACTVDEDDLAALDLDVDLMPTR
ncbi:ML domain-containing protein [Kitasatospora sp. NPDC098652]|uniref:ML domain-containing protein n=1 Tax=Kitasatospora sp. NPDC098652 TaxID=3364095 RepID=UPI0038249592